MTANKSDIHSTIRTITDNFEETFSVGDLNKLVEFYSDIGLLLPAGFDFVKGKNDIKEFWQSAMDMGIKNIQIDIIEIDQYDDTAIEMSNYILSDTEKEVIDAGKGIVIWKNLGNGWKMHRDIWTTSLEQQ